MNSISCNVIRDLLPSYMDKIASDDSVKLVEEHLAQCSECMDFKARMEKPDLHIPNEEVDLDYMKKIRKLTALKSSVCFFLILITGIFFLDYTKDLQPTKPFLVLAATMLLSNYLLFFQNSDKTDAGKLIALIPNAVSILLIGCMVFMMQLSVHNWINDKNAPFHIDYAKLGPFLDYQFRLTRVIELIIWLRELVLYIRKARFSIISSSLSIIGFYMSSYYSQMLRSITTLDGFRVINSNAFLLFMEGVGILLLFIIIEKLKNKRNMQDAAF